MATISTSGISAGQIIRSEHLLRVINALNGVTPIDIIITGSLSVTGSTSLSGSTYLKGIPNTSRANVITYDPTTGQLSYLDSASLGVTMSISQPGGSNTQIQYNSGSVLAGTGSFTFNYNLQSLQNGLNVSASNTYAHAQGNATTASGQYSHAEGATTNAKGLGSHAEGTGTIASGSYSHAEGAGTLALADHSHAEGNNTRATQLGAHAEGERTLASNYYAHAEGYYTTASGIYTHTEGYNTIASGSYSHAEGESTLALGGGSHAEGYNTTSSGAYSHAEGRDTIAAGGNSHAEGSNTITYGNFSHAEGVGTITSGSYQHVQGAFNISSSAQKAFIIGNGYSDAFRSNLVFASGSTFQVTGSLQVLGSITGSLFGTSSWALNELVSSSLIDSYIGTRIFPSNTSSNGFAINRNVNGAVGLTIKNSDTSGNGAYSAVSLTPSGSWYDTGSAFIYFNGGYYVSSLRNTGGIFSSVNTNILLTSNKDFSVQTGNDISTLSTKFRVSGIGNVYIPAGNLEITGSSIITGSLIITGSQFTTGNSSIGTTMVIGSTTQGQILGNSALLLYRGQSNTAFTLGNPGIGQTNDIIIDNTLGSFISSSGFLSLNTPTGSLTLNGSGSVTINDILVLTPRTTTPTLPTAGMTIVSGSGVDQHIYCYLNSTWKQLD